jgi:Insecticide toxin TcdB middle/N-terminal region/Salmonella virulence plasmid 65kDa B protein/FG-GAP-like repeat
MTSAQAHGPKPIVAGTNAEPMAQTWQRGIALRGAAALLCLVAGAGVAAAQGMALPGKVEVSPTGAATYRIPIAVPPGTAGLAPALALEYSSQGGNGLVGMGWTLAGLPSITRCPRTMAQDGAWGTINYDYNDRFCLEGQRLSALNGGAYGGDGTEYRTEIDSYARIISHGGGASGPTWFEVRAKNGQMMEFGATPDARIYAEGTATVRAWAVNQVSDTKGNYITIGYANYVLWAYPDHIYYAANDSTGTGNTSGIWFSYENRPETGSFYRGGAHTQLPVRLKTIDIYTLGSLVSSYRLAYELSPTTQRSRLASVQVCGGDGACVPPTTFAWQNVNVGQQFAGASIWAATFGTGPQNGGMTDNTTYPRYIADVNGDGLPDVVGFHYNDVFVLLNTGSSFTGALSWLHCSFTTGCQWPAEGQAQDATTAFACRKGASCRLSYPRYVVDVNGDGLPDILGIDGHGVYVSLNDAGTKFDPPQLWLACHFTPECSFTDENLYPRYLIDVNGDGLPDIVGFGPNTVNVSLNTGTSFGQPQVWLNCTYTRDCGGWLDNATYPRYLADVNGDGLPDIVAIGGDQIFVTFNTGSSFAGIETWLYCSFTPNCGGWPGDTNGFARYMVDMNGDGLADFVAIGWNYVYVALSTGKGFTTQAWHYCTFTPWCGGWTNESHYPRYFADVNGDGLPDIVGIGYDSVLVALNTGSSLVGAGSWIVCSFTAGCAGWSDNNVYPRFIVDVNGDGRADILGFAYSGTYVATAAGSGTPDLLASVTNGLGVTTSVTHRNLSDPAFYPRDAGTRHVPTVDLTGAFPVVSRVDSANGIGGTYATTYGYAGARIDISGLGFLGFRQTSVTDVQTGIVKTTNYRQNFPFIGLVDSATKTLNGLTLNSTSSSYSVINASGGTSLSAPTWAYAPYRVTLWQSYDASWDLDGSPIPAMAAEYEYDAFGNPTQISTWTGDGASKTTVNTYTNDTTNWYLGRLTNAQVTSSQP